ncbi:MAG: sarcosine oxidase subunit gamma [Rhodobacterales bacterium]|nr:sarcosine oxidase subunit gamma [Rhodobacterales bacterium]MDX5412260.1 sarcosine oxidase subunit gamma [Rhodobacterales bacterium]
MSEPVSALNGASFDGLVTLKDSGPTGMITLRGDLAAKAMAQALDKAMGLSVPAQRKIVATADGSRMAAWMSPDELLLILPYADTGKALDALGSALAGTHHLAENVSDARALIAVSGPDARVREVLAKLAPVDLHPSAFAHGDIRRTRLAQVAGAFWMSEAGQAHVICFRSVAQYAFDLLRAAADPAAAVEYFG